MSSREKFADAVAEFFFSVTRCDGVENDWLTHVPPDVAPALELVGRLWDTLLTALGYAC